MPKVLAEREGTPEPERQLTAQCADWLAGGPRCVNIRNRSMIGGQFERMNIVARRLNIGAAQRWQAQPGITQVGKRRREDSGFKAIAVKRHGLPGVVQ